MTENTGDKTKEMRAQENAPATVVPSAPPSIAIESDDPLRTSSSTFARILAAIGS
jgi:hypothetical protein